VAVTGVLLSVLTQTLDLRMLAPSIQQFGTDPCVTELMAGRMHWERLCVGCTKPTAAVWLVLRNCARCV
jgi:hypothetical protein